MYKCIKRGMILKKTGFMQAIDANSSTPVRKKDAEKYEYILNK